MTWFSLYVRVIDKHGSWTDHMVCTSRQCLIKWINATSKQGKHEYLIHEQNKTKVVVGACMFWYIYPLIGCCGESCFKSMKKNEENKSKFKYNKSNWFFDLLDIF